MINLSALVSPKIEKFILFRVITYHIHTKMAKKYEFHTMNFMPLRLFFWPFEAIFGPIFVVGVRFKNIFGNYLC